ncbi:MAG: hypothetical protein ACK48D_12285 [Pseudanabaena sp.]
MIAEPLDASSAPKLMPLSEIFERLLLLMVNLAIALVDRFISIPSALAALLVMLRIVLPEISTIAVAVELQAGKSG